MTDNPVKDHYENLVELKYQLYNSLFLTLPLDAVEQTSLLLPLLDEASHVGLKAGLNPKQILVEFFKSHRPDLDEQKQAQFLFKIIQYIERQVVLIDALEDAAYEKIHRTEESNKFQHEEKNHIRFYLRSECFEKGSGDEFLTFLFSRIYKQAFSKVYTQYINTINFQKSIRNLKIMYSLEVFPNTNNLH